MVNVERTDLYSAARSSAIMAEIVTESGPLFPKPVDAVDDEHKEAGIVQRQAKRLCATQWRLGANEMSVEKR
jgi:hypothetical protein